MPSTDSPSPAIARPILPNKRATVGVLIRFASSAETLPDVLTALQNQTVRPDFLMGVDSGSQDNSRALIEAAGGQVIEWSQRYEHSKVLNFGLRYLETDLVLILSSHTVLEDPETLACMVDAMSSAGTACVSLKWDEDPFYSDAIDWRELSTKGLKFGSIYSNSMGMIRRSLWGCHPFDESLDTAEDYAWALHQLDLGLKCCRLALPFRYRRSGSNRDYDFARMVFGFAKQYRLKVTWLGLRATFITCLKGIFKRNSDTALHRARLFAYCRALQT
jgi:glycosyltransferase involved in cell wall biosynthesis